MKLPRLLLSILVSVCLLSFVQAAERNSPESERAVLQLERDFIAAALKSDAAAIEPMLADGFYFVGSDGSVQTKAAFLAPIRSGDLKMLASDVVEMEVHFSSPDMVVLTYRSADRGTFKGTEFSGNFRWSDVVVKRNGRWQFLVAQGTAIAPAK